MLVTCQSSIQLAPGITAATRLTGIVAAVFLRVAPTPAGAMPTRRSMLDRRTRPRLANATLRQAVDSHEGE